MLQIERQDITSMSNGTSEITKSRTQPTLVSDIADYLQYPVDVLYCDRIPLVAGIKR
jgi:hypothetical protein